MIVVGLDLETTGLDKAKDRTIEVCTTLWSTNFNRSLGSSTILVQSDGVSIPPEVTEKTHITQAMVDKFGESQEEAFANMAYWLGRAEAVVAFNGRRFDVPLSKNWAKRVGQAFPDLPIIDPFTDTPLKADAASPGMPGQELITMCAKEGIYYSAHEAGADVGAMLALMSRRPFEFVWQRSQSPVVVVRSKQDRSQNDKAKKHKFRWNPDRRIWWKAVKEIDLNVLAKAVNNEFGLEVLDIPIDEMETDD